MMTISISFIQVVLATSLSGTISGLVFIFFNKLDGLGGMWFPGIVFGLIFGIASFHTAEMVISYSVLSGIAYAMAVWIYILLFPSIGAYMHINHPLMNAHPEKGKSTLETIIVDSLLAILDIRGLMIAGFLAGAVGAVFLEIALKLFSDVSQNLVDGIIALIVGGLVGLVFILILLLGAKYQWISVSLAFICWQVSVGLTISFGINSESVVVPGSLADLLKAFLQSPIILLIGFAASGACVIDFLKSRSKTLPHIDDGRHIETSPLNINQVIQIGNPYQGPIRDICAQLVEIEWRLPLITQALVFLVSCIVLVILVLLYISVGLISQITSIFAYLIRQARQDMRAKPIGQSRVGKVDKKGQRV